MNYSTKDVICAYWAHQARTQAIIRKMTPQEVTLENVQESERAAALSMCDAGLELLQSANLTVGYRKLVGSKPFIGTTVLTISAGYYNGITLDWNIYLVNGRKQDAQNG